MTTKQEALEFLEKIEKKDKVGIITHDDLDGFASGVLLVDFLKKKGCNVKVEIFNYKDNANQIESSLKDCDKIIITDIAPFGVNALEKLCKNKPVLNIDHHPKDLEISSKILEYRSEGYVPASRMVFELVGGKDWLALAGVLADYGDKYPENKDFINKLLGKLKLKQEEFNKKEVFQLIDFIIYFEDGLKKAFELLTEINSMDEIKKIEKYYKPVEDELDRLRKEFHEKHEEFEKIIYFHCKPKFKLKLKSILISSLSCEEPDKIYVFTSLDENGKTIGLSARNQSREFDTPSVLKPTIAGFKDSSIGGHRAAAGGFFLKKDMEKFKENLKELGRKI